MWERLDAFFNTPLDMDWWAAREIADIRRAVRVNYHDPAEAIPVEVARIMNEIRITNEVGGLKQNKIAFHIWKVARKLYPDRITEDDKPILIPC